MSLVIAILALAVIVGLGFIGGELFGKLRLPKVLGYIIVGMLIGPYALGLIDVALFEIEFMMLFLTVAIGYVGYLVGAGIHVKEIKEAGGQMTVIALLASYFAMFLVAAAMYFLLGFDALTSLIIGSIALATSPIVALSIVREYKTKGPVTKALMPIVAIDDVLAVITFGVLIAFATTLYSGVESSIIEPFVEVFLSVGVGAVTGFLGSFALRKIQGKVALAIASAVLLLVTMAVTHVVHAEMLLAGIAFGFVVINRLGKEQQKRLTEANKPAVAISVVIALVLIGATLNIFALFSVVVIVGALVYILARAVGKIGGVMVGASLTKAEKTVKKYLGFTLLPAAGVTLVFVGVAVTIVPVEYAGMMSALIAAAAIINELIAVFATRWAFGKSGEMGKEQNDSKIGINGCKESEEKEKSVVRTPLIP